MGRAAEKQATSGPAVEGDFGFAQIFARYFRDVARLCANLLGSSEAGEDAAQETFERALRHFEDFDKDRDPWPWLSTIARRRCFDILRNAKWTELSESPESLTQSCRTLEDSTAEAVIEQTESQTRWRRLGRAFHELNARDRTVLWLRLEEGWSYEAIADRLTSSVDAVRNAAWRARRQLQGNLRRPLVIIPILVAAIHRLSNRVRLTLSKMARITDKLLPAVICVQDAAMMTVGVVALTGIFNFSAGSSRHLDLILPPSSGRTTGGNITELVAGIASIPRSRPLAHSSTIVGGQIAKGSIDYPPARDKALEPNHAEMYIEVDDPNGNVLVSDRIWSDCSPQGGLELPPDSPIRTRC
jgi:RNA polymerase sigma-70 factor (ECF subfamily)